MDHICYFRMGFKTRYSSICEVRFTNRFYASILYLYNYDLLCTAISGKANIYVQNPQCSDLYSLITFWSYDSLTLNTSAVYITPRQFNVKHIMDKNE